MDCFNINFLEDDLEVGKKILDYFGLSKLDFIVYEFCKMFKEYSIRCFDIVKELFGYFLVFSLLKVYV